MVSFELDIQPPRRPTSLEELHQVISMTSRERDKGNWVATTGLPVAGENFFGRADELKKIEELARTGKNILLVGKPRSGKSSVMAELSTRFPQQYLKYIDLQPAQTQEDAISMIKKIMDRFLQERGENGERPIVIQLDEIVKLFEGGLNIGNIAAEISKAYSTSNKKVSFILASQLPLSEYRKKFPQESFFGDMKEVVIEPLISEDEWKKLGMG